MPQFIFANFVQTTLSATASTTDTSLSITSAAYLPTLESGQQFPLTLVDAATETIFEIVYVTAVSGTTLTVLRAQEGTVAQDWKIGDLVKGSPTTATTSPSPGTHYPIASETLPTTLGKLSVLPGALTADITLTLPGSGDAGSETTIYGSAAAYTTTVASPVTSGSPYIEMPDGSQVYSYVIPASSPGAGIRSDFDGTNYRATTFGTTIVAPAVASNEAVNLGQFPASLSENGYQKLASGLIIQWGQYNAVDADTVYDVTLPIAFPTRGQALLVTPQDGGTTVASAQGYFVNSSKIGLISSTASTDLGWLAIGY